MEAESNFPSLNTSVSLILIGPAVLFYLLGPPCDKLVIQNSKTERTKLCQHRIKKELIKKKEIHPMKPTLDSHKIMILHNAGHDDSFSRVLQNKVAFYARGWNPMK